MARNTGRPRGPGRRDLLGIQGALVAPGRRDLPQGDSYAGRVAARNTGRPQVTPRRDVLGMQGALGLILLDYRQHLIIARIAQRSRDERSVQPSPPIATGGICRCSAGGCLDPNAQASKRRQYLEIAFPTSLTLLNLYNFSTLVFR